MSPSISAQHCPAGDYNRELSPAAGRRYADPLPAARYGRPSSPAICTDLPAPLPLPLPPHCGKKTTSGNAPVGQNIAGRAATSAELTARTLYSTFNQVFNSGCCSLYCILWPSVCAVEDRPGGPVGQPGEAGRYGDGCSGRLRTVDQEQINAAAPAQISESDSAASVGKDGGQLESARLSGRRRTLT
jgi:hypothetical protein